jgi:hypothetical protein
MRSGLTADEIEALPDLTLWVSLEPPPLPGPSRSQHREATDG